MSHPDHEPSSASPAAVTHVLQRSISSSFSSGISSLELLSSPQPSIARPLKATELRISVRACALNYFDLLILVGKYQIKPKLPFVPGSEFSGIITEIGSKVKNFKVGDCVFAAMTIGQGLGREAILQEFMCVHKPEALNWAEAAAFPVGFYTAFHGLVQRGALKAGEWLLVTGAAGGMGLAAVQLGKKLGARIIAVASTEAKQKQAIACGADYAVSPAKLREEVKRLTEDRGVDVAYEVVGGQIFESVARSMASGGRLLVVGFASGSIPNLPMNLPLVKGFQIVGVRSGAEMMMHPQLHKEMNQAMKQYFAGNNRDLAPFLHRVYPIQQFKEAFQSIAGREVIGKSVISWEDEAQQKSTQITAAKPLKSQL